MSKTEQTLRSILRYTGHAQSHTALSTVHMLANEALEEYMREKAELSKQLMELEVAKVTTNNASLEE